MTHERKQEILRHCGPEALAEVGALETELAKEQGCYQTLLKHAAVLEEQRDQLERELSEAQHKLSTDGITGLRAAYDVLASEWGEAQIRQHAAEKENTRLRAAVRNQCGMREKAEAFDFCQEYVAEIRWEWMESTVTLTVAKRGGHVKVYHGVTLIDAIRAARASQPSEVKE